ncbi:MAG: hypothetical protein ACO4CT_07235 [Planctomycetota bacterium]|jgi:hypothetical protein
MLRTSLLAGVVVVTLTAWNAGHATTPAVSASTTDPVPTTVSADGTVIATVEIDHRGVRVLTATRKPSLGFRKSGADADHPFGWILRDAAGDVLAQGGFDPAKVCRDPSHAGQPPHVVGCEVVPHTAHANVKLPDMGARAATLEFVDRTSVSSPLPLGAIRWSALPLR